MRAPADVRRDSLPTDCPPDRCAFPCAEIVATLVIVAFACMVIYESRQHMEKDEASVQEALRACIETDRRLRDALDMTIESTVDTPTVYGWYAPTKAQKDATSWLDYNGREVDATWTTQGGSALIEYARAHPKARCIGPVARVASREGSSPA